MQAEIDKYELVDLEKTPISKTKMKFNAKRIKEKIDLLLSPAQQEKENDNFEPVLDLTQIAEYAVEHEGIGLTDLQQLKTIKAKSIEKGEEEVTYE